MKRNALARLVGVGLVVALTAACHTSEIMGPEPTSTTVAVATTVVEPEPDPASNALIGTDVPGVYLHRVDPVTLRDICGFEPMALGHGFVVHHPDRSVLAAVAVEIADGGRADLYLIDPLTWSASLVHTFSRGEGDAYSTDFDATGRFLTWWDGSELHRYDLDQDHHEVIARGLVGDTVQVDEQTVVRATYLDNSLRVFRSQVGGAQELVAEVSPAPWALSSAYPGRLVGIVDGEGGAPRVVVIDVDRGELAEQELPWLRIGWEFDETLEEIAEEHWWLPQRAYFPGVAWDTERSIVYLAHPDEEAVTVVDLVEMVATRHEIRDRLSLGQRVLAWLIPPTLAKGEMPGADRQAVLSPDGSVLYVTGSISEPTEDEEGDWWLQTRPSGLQVIETDGMTRIASTDLPVSQLVVSPDGSLLLAWGATTAERGFLGRHEDHGPFLLDSSSFDLVWEMETDGPNWTGTFSEDGLYAYLENHERVDVLDLETLQVTERRKAYNTSLLDHGLLTTWEARVRSDVQRDCDPPGTGRE